MSPSILWGFILIWDRSFYVPFKKDIKHFTTLHLATHSYVPLLLSRLSHCCTLPTHNQAQQNGKVTCVCMNHGAIYLDSSANIFMLKKSLGFHEMKLQ